MPPSAEGPSCDLLTITAGEPQAQCRRSDHNTCLTCTGCTGQQPPAAAFRTGACTHFRAVQPPEDRHGLHDRQKSNTCQADTPLAVLAGGPPPSLPPSLLLPIPSGTAGSHKNQCCCRHTATSHTIQKQDLQCWQTMCNNCWTPAHAAVAGGASVRKVTVAQQLLATSRGAREQQEGGELIPAHGARKLPKLTTSNTKTTKVGQTCDMSLSVSH